MASSGYQLWNVVAGEQPTTAKWNILGNNDSSFNSGVGFNDAIIATRHMALSKSTDANGWTVYNFGNYSVYNKRYTNNGAAVTSGTVYSLTLSPNLPVGISSIGATTFIHIMLCSNNAYGYQWASESFVGGTSINVTYKPDVNVSLTGYWDVQIWA